MSAPTANTPPAPLKAHVRTLLGVGPERASQLARLKIFTIEDLLLHRPRRYEDRRHFRTIAELDMDAPATTRGSIVAMGLKTYQRGAKSVFEIILEDGTARLHCRWWNLPFMQNYFAKGDEVFVFGKLNSLKPRTIDHPETEVIEGGEESSIHINRIAPIYPLTEGLPQRWLRSLIWRALNQFEHEIPDPWNDAVRSVNVPPGPDANRLNRVGRGQASLIFPSQQQGLLTSTAANFEGKAGAMKSGPPPFPSRPNAIRRLHFPESIDDIEVARRRLALDEFLDLQSDIKIRRDRFETRARGLPCSGDNHLIRPFLKQLGFTLTPAQTRVLRELRHDLGGAHPMRRLLQGDVGSGKTVVAACCALMALESSYHVALMAPTEILATQHFQTFQKWFEPLGIEVHLQTGSIKTGSASSSRPLPVRKDLRARPEGPSRLTVGTHALIQSGFAMERLGLVIIDEQHKFGVTQREELLRKGTYPHLLVMTATPIPRTLGLTLYGELDISIIDEMPAGRGHLKTYVRAADTLLKVWDFVRKKLAEGRQAYIVYPRVEETSGGLKAVTKEFDNLKKNLAPYRVGLLHGRLKSDEKDSVMAAFRANKLNVLLATPLIEVGLDVPNATIMLIENAESFGLAQLHQLRGRIGRGAHDSHCILIAAAKNPEARQRLAVLEKSNDGFEIAEADLQLRGPGELLGQQQSGLPPFRFGDLVQDAALVALARKIVAEIH